MKSYLLFSICFFGFILSSNSQKQFIAHTIMGGEFTSFGVNSVRATDIDSDGDVDLVASSEGDKKISWYENNGNQIFKRHIIHDYGEVPIDVQSVLAVDFDKDGDVDIFSIASSTVSFANQHIMYHVNDGNENFISFPILKNSNTKGGYSISVTDINGDGKLDVVFPNGSAIAWYELNQQGDFIFHNLRGFTTDVPSSIDTEDMDGDGDKDVLIATGGDEIRWYENNGLGNFSKSHIVAMNLKYPNSLLAIDFDMDGDMDILTSTSGDDKIIYFENLGNNNFINFNISTTADGANSIYAIDIDKDNDIDVLSASGLDDKICLYLNNGDKNFITKVISLDANYAKSVWADDIDSDGDIDIISASKFDSKIAWYENDGNENFTTHLATFPANGYNSVRSFDVDKDGDLDVLSTSEFGDRVCWFENDGNENFTPHIISNELIGPKSLFTADINNDGFIDIVSSSLNGNKIAWFENNGDGEFISHFTTTTIGRAAFIFPVDLDGNGDVDIISGTKLSLYSNDGSGNFVYSDIHKDANVSSIFASDIDGDADIDITCRLSGEPFISSNKIGWFENNGTKEFSLHIIKDSILLGDVFTEDLDDDGDMDVISPIEDGLAWLENDGKENFTSHILLGNKLLRYIPNSFFVVDIDNDGDKDMVAASSGSGKIVWYQNDGKENFEIYVIRTDMYSSFGYISVYYADLDSDGDNDILSASRQDAEITWYENLTIDNSSTNSYVVRENQCELFNYPNPFSSNTTVNFKLSISSNVKIDIYDINGRVVKTLVDRKYESGKYSDVWYGENNSGGKVPSGVYFLQMRAGDFLGHNKIIFMR